MLKVVDRVLGARLVAANVGEALLDGVGDRHQQRAGRRLAVAVEELPHPAIDLVAGIEIAALDRTREIGHFLRPVGERIGPGIALHPEIGRVERQMVEQDIAVEGQRVRLLAEAGDGDAIAEHVVDPAQIHRLGRDPEPYVDQPLVIALLRPEHHPVLPEGDRMPVAVGRDVADRKPWHAGVLVPAPSSGQPDTHL